jgi:hypothetical protein
MNDEKEILKVEDIDAYNLAEMIHEASPYLVLIPKQEATIPMSASLQYQSLCLLKDVKKLCKFNVSHSPKRLSQLLPTARSTTNKFVRHLNLLNIENMYNFKKSVEVSTMDRILCDEAIHLTLRDLPSFYGCATGLL